MIVARVSSTLDLPQQVQRLQPDVVIIDLDSPDRDTLENIAIVSRDNPRPIIDVAIARFREFQAMRDELEHTRDKLSEHKLVERASGKIILRRCSAAPPISSSRTRTRRVL